MSGAKKEEMVLITDLAGGDDLAALAYILARAQVEDTFLRLVGSYGNRSTEVTYHNLHSTLPQLQSNLKGEPNTTFGILRGADRPTGAVQSYELPSDDVVYKIHGDMGNDGLGGGRVESSRIHSSTDYYLSLLQAGQKIEVLSLAATSEVASLLKILAESGIVFSIVMMGGTVKYNGNTDPLQEANFRHDPDATHTILQLATKNDIPLTIVPLDVTEQEGVLFTAERMQYLKDRLKNSPKGLQVLEQVAGPHSIYGRFYLHRTKPAESFPYLEEPYQGVPIHDLTAAVVQSDLRNKQNLFEYAKVSIKPNELGQIGIARPYMTPNFPVQIAGPLKDFDAYWQHIVELFQQYK